MEPTEKASFLKEHEKFWAFVFLVLAVIGLVALASTFDKGTTATDLVMQAKLRIIDSAIAGLLTITGMAAQALFRISSIEKAASDNLTKLVDERRTGEPQKVEIAQPENKPVPIKESELPSSVFGER